MWLEVSLSYVRVVLKSYPPLICLASIPHPPRLLTAAVFQTLVQLGGALGLAFVGVVQTSVTRNELKKGADHVSALLKGLHGSFWFGAAASFTAMIIALTVLRGMGTYGGKGKGEAKGEGESAASSATLEGTEGEREKERDGEEEEKGRSQV